MIEPRKGYEVHAMKIRKFTEDQIAFALNQAGISPAAGHF